MSWLLNAASKLADVGASIVDKITEVDDAGGSGSKVTTSSSSPAAIPQAAVPRPAASSSATPAVSSQQPQWASPACAATLGLPPPPPINATAGVKRHQPAAAPSLALPFVPPPLPPHKAVAASATTTTTAASAIAAGSPVASNTSKSVAAPSFPAVAAAAAVTVPKARGFKPGNASAAKPQSSAASAPSAPAVAAINVQQAEGHTLRQQQQPQWNDDEWLGNAATSDPKKRQAVTVDVSENTRQADSAQQEAKEAATVIEAKPAQQHQQQQATSIASSLWGILSSVTRTDDEGEKAPSTVSAAPAAKDVASISAASDVVVAPRAFNFFSAIVEAGAGAIIGTLDAANSALDRAAEATSANRVRDAAAARFRELHDVSFPSTTTRTTTPFTFQHCYDELSQTASSTGSHSSSTVLDPLFHRLPFALQHRDAIFDFLASDLDEASRRRDANLRALCSSPSPSARRVSVAQFAATESPAIRRVECIATDFASSTRSWYAQGAARITCSVSGSHSTSSSYSYYSSSRGNGGQHAEHDEGKESVAAAFIANLDALYLVSSARIQDISSEWIDAVSQELRIFAQLLHEPPAFAGSSVGPSTTTIVTTNLGQIQKMQSDDETVERQYCADDGDHLIAILAFMNSALQQLELAVSAALDVATSASLLVLQAGDLPFASDAEQHNHKRQQQQKENERGATKSSSSGKQEQLQPVPTALQSAMISQLCDEYRRYITRWAGAAVAVAEGLAVDIMEQLSERQKNILHQQQQKRQLPSDASATMKQVKTTTTARAAVASTLPESPSHAAADRDDGNSNSAAQSVAPSAAVEPIPLIAAPAAAAGTAAPAKPRRGFVPTKKA